MSISSMDEFEEEQEEDEEELLQRALQEQAQRDLQYGRPVNHPAPVVSRAAAGPGPGPPARQPPPAPPVRRPPPPRPSQPQPQSQVVDDESDVELLSLSSEDDEPEDLHQTQQRAAPHHTKMDHYYDLDEDDGEPDCWKRVNEEELAKMVREIKDTKLTASVNLRKGPTFKRKTSVLSEGISRVEDLTDPLGIGMIDTRTLTLVTESAASHKDEGANAGQLSAPKDPSLKEKITYHSERFDPKLFLSHVHRNTAHAELESGKQSLKIDLQQRKQQLKLLVKDNFDCFVSCKNTIDDIHLKLQQIETDIEGAGTVHLSNAICEVNKVANRAFEPLFERQVQAEQIRSVQGMLQRFRTLFNLPSTIRNYITKGEFDLAVREYKKAKSLVLPTHVRVLKRVLEEVEKVIAEFKDKLYKNMDDPSVEFSQLESTVRLLLELEPGSDPVWHYITLQSCRIRGLLEGCSMEHDEKMDELHKQSWAKAQSDARWKQMQQAFNKASDINYSSLFGDQEREPADISVGKFTTQQSDALQSRLIRRVSIVVMQQVPPFWRLAVAIFNGKFSKVSQGGFAQGKPKQTSGPQISISNGTDAGFKGHSLSEVDGMVIDILTMYESKVLNAFLALSELDVLGPHMRGAVEEVCKVCIALESKDAAPPSAVQVLCALKIQIARHFILRLCSFMLTTSSRMGSEEEWVPVPTIEHAGSEFAISALPLRFRDLFVSTMDQIQGMLERLKLEPLEAVDLTTQVQQMEDSVKSAFFTCFFSLGEALDKLASIVSQHCEELESRSLSNGHYPSEDHFTGLQAGVEVANPHQQLLMVLSNAGYCKTVLLPDLLQKYHHIWNILGRGKGQEDSEPAMMEKLMAAFSATEENVLGQYTRTKATQIGTSAAAFFLEDGLQWGAAPTVKGIRDAAVELLYPLVAVHAELYAGAKLYLEKAIPILIEGLMDALLNVFNHNKLKALRVIDLNGFSQLALELSYLEAVLHSHFTGSAQTALSSLRSQLREKVLDTLREAETLGHRRSTTRGIEDSLTSEERLQNASMSAEELKAMEQQVCADFLQLELKRTRLITVCFTNAHQQMDYIGDNNTSRYSARLMSTVSSNPRAPLSPGSSFSRHRRLLSASSLSDSDSGKPSVVHPSQSPLSHSGYASSDVGSEGGGVESRVRSERYLRAQGDARRPSRRAMFGMADDDLR